MLASVTMDCQQHYKQLTFSQLCSILVVEELSRFLEVFFLLFPLYIVLQMPPQPSKMYPTLSTAVAVPLAPANVGIVIPPWNWTPSWQIKDIQTSWLKKNYSALSPLLKPNKIKVCNVYYPMNRHTKSHGFCSYSAWEDLWEEETWNRTSSNSKWKHKPV